MNVRVSALAIVAACFCLVGCGGGREARLASATAGIEHALSIQPLLQHSRTCPVELAGWEPHSRHLSALATRAGSAELRFDCDQNRAEFSVTVVYSFDDYAYVAGPFDGPLHIQYGHFTASKKMGIPANPDIPALARVLAFGS